MKLEEILSIKVLELLLVLVGSKIYGKSIFDDKESKTH